MTIETNYEVQIWGWCKNPYGGCSKDRVVEFVFDSQKEAKQFEKALFRHFDYLKKHKKELLTMKYPRD